MSTLRIEFDIGINWNEDDAPIDPIILPQLTPPGILSNDSDSSQSDTLYVRQGKRIHRGRRAIVFACQMQQGEETPIDVVLKLTTLKAHHDDLIKEAGFYENQLAAVQGNVVPWFYGIFQGQFRSRFMTCMVLEHCGEPMGQAQYEDIDFKAELINRLGYLHSFCGIEHGDVRGSNILVKDGFAVFIGFEYARPHKCERTMMIEIGKPWPQELEFGCIELHDAGKDFGLWGPAIVEFLDGCISVYQITSAKRLVELTLRNEYTDPADALEEAREFVQYLVGIGTLPESVLKD
ncbi:hypothetical protein BKA93DRAFT_822940 [Sparassis latifolia]